MPWSEASILDARPAGSVLLCDPVEELPLARCDWRRRAAGDVMLIELKCRARTGEKSVMRQNHDHEWCYFPNMTPEQALLLRTFDGMEDRRTRFVVRIAFEDPVMRADATKRQSVEIRSMAFVQTRLDCEDGPRANPGDAAQLRGIPKEGGKNMPGLSLADPARYAPAARCPGLNGQHTSNRLEKPFRERLDRTAEADGVSLTVNQGRTDPCDLDGHGHLAVAAAGDLVARFLFAAGPDGYRIKGPERSGRFQ